MTFIGSYRRFRIRKKRCRDRDDWVRQPAVGDQRSSPDVSAPLVRGRAVPLPPSPVPPIWRLIAAESLQKGQFF